MNTPPPDPRSPNALRATAAFVTPHEAKAIKLCRYLRGLGVTADIFKSLHNGTFTVEVYKVEYASAVWLVKNSDFFSE